MCLTNVRRVADKSEELAVKLAIAKRVAIRGSRSAACAQRPSYGIQRKKSPGGYPGLFSYEGGRLLPREVTWRRDAWERLAVLDLFEKNLDSLVKLLIDAGLLLYRIVVDVDVRIDTMVLDNPLAGST